MAIWLRRATPDAPGNVGTIADVIPARSFAAMLRLDEGYRQLEEDRAAVLADARAQAQAIVAAAQARAAEIEEQAQALLEGAHERGYENGREAALADWFDNAAGAAQVQQQLHDRMRERMADLVVIAAEQIIGVESRQAMMARASTALEANVEQATYMHVKVHPDDFEAAQAEFGRLAERRRDAGSPLPLLVTSDRGLAVGSCLCETDIGTADASLATQLRAMRIAVNRALDVAADNGPGYDAGHHAEHGAGHSALAEKFAGDGAGDADGYDARAPGPEPEFADEELLAEDGADDEFLDEDDDVDAWMRELNEDKDEPSPRDETHYMHKD